MKKSLILVGMLSIGYANAQEYDGRVGINTEEPKATLDITAYKTDGSTKEGLLIPRLAKVAVTKMVNPEISTLVYVTDEVLASDSAKFQGTGKGFYYYNGTKWVKQLDKDNDINTELWAQRTNGNITETYLKPADEKNTDQVAYLDNNGVRNWRLNIGNVQNADLVYNGTAGTGFKMEESIRGNFLSSDAFPKQRVQNGSSNFFFNTSQGIIKDTHASRINRPSYFGNESRIIARNVNTALGSLYGANSSIDVFSNNEVATIIGGAMATSAGSDVDGFKPTVANNIGGQMTARNYGTSTNMFGARAYVNNYGTASNLRGIQISTSSQIALNGTTAQHTIASLRGLQNLANVNENATVTGDIYSSFNDLNVGPNATLDNTTIRGVYSRISTNTTTAPVASIVNYQAVFRPTGTQVGTYVDYGTYPSLQAGSSVKEYIGYNMSPGNSVADSTIENFYGVKIGNLTKGTNSNFAIHTGARGIVHIGDKLGVGTETPTQRIEANGNILANQGGLMSSLNNAIGGYVELQNPMKDTGKEVQRWRIYNMTEKDPTYNYVPGLHFWSYAADGTNLSSQMVLTDEGNLGVGFVSRVSNSGLLGEKFEVNGNIRSVGLKGTGNRNVYADENGVLRAGDAADTQAGKVASNDGVQCTEDNRGTMNFGRVSINGKETDAIGFCMKNSDNQFRWYYIYGGASHTVGTSATFGTGL